MGEMVIKKPMPSMPLYFWGDKNLRDIKIVILVFSQMCGDMAIG
ncbi:MAG: hypothetical protein CM1200mP7_3230 [Chloroflexota bacterium]|nr:MAG: hypothetical protein CM1200mP7_3230 [Chloroflexota bacterium]